MEIPRKKIAVIFGTRPDTIKLAPVIQELQKHEQNVSLCLIASGQHREMLDDVLSVFSIVPNYDLNVMSMRQSLSLLAQSILEKLDYVFAMEQPDLVIVQGDTATSFVSCLAAFHRKIPIAHVEAGLRTNEKMYPYPEETYRRMISHITDLHFTPTPMATKALLREGISRTSIVCTGNTAIDALQRTIRSEYEFTSKPLIEVIAQKKRMVVVTIHRRENLGEPMLNICSALKALAMKNVNTNFVFPIHVIPAVRETVFALLKEIPNIALMEPLNYPDFINLIARSYAVITDSGGLQEEAPSLGKPVLLFRSITERPEAVKTGNVKLVATDSKNILTIAHKMLNDKKIYRSMSSPARVFGDGKASERIVQSLLLHFGFTKKKPKEFSGRGI